MKLTEKHKSKIISETTRDSLDRTLTSKLRTVMYSRLSICYTLSKKPDPCYILK